MVISGDPAIAKIGVFKFLASAVWNPDKGMFVILPGTMLIWHLELLNIQYVFFCKILNLEVSQF